MMEKNRKNKKEMLTLIRDTDVKNRLVDLVGHLARSFLAFWVAPGPRHPQQSKDDQSVPSSLRPQMLPQPHSATRFRDIPPLAALAPVPSSDGSPHSTGDTS